MAVKSKAGTSSTKLIIVHKPKTTRQGNSRRNSKPRGTRKLRIGQGKN